MTAHKHCELMKQYAEDAAETDKPYERWEFKDCVDKEWAPCGDSPRWHAELQYRRKPRTLTYTITIPEPLRKPLEQDEHYYVAQPLCRSLYTRDVWTDHETDHLRLQRGLLFATPEDAAEAAKAMLPFKGEGV